MGESKIIDKTSESEGMAYQILGAKIPEGNNKNISKQELIKQIEEKRGGKVITYLASDRRGSIKRRVGVKQ